MGSLLFVIGFVEGGGENTWHVVPFKNNPHTLAFLRKNLQDTYKSLNQFTLSTQQVPEKHVIK
jgi:hypothetical protein